MDQGAIRQTKGVYREFAGRFGAQGQPSSIYRYQEIVVLTSRSATFPFLDLQVPHPLGRPCHAPNLILPIPIWTGSFAESTGPEHQMHWIIENAKTVREAQGITIIVDALKLLSVKHEQLAYVELFNCNTNSRANTYLTFYFSRVFASSGNAPLPRSPIKLFRSTCLYSTLRSSADCKHF
jgi:hypothetical protein